MTVCLADYAGEFGDQTGLNGNVSADPLFVDSSGGDYSLRPGSPCIDAGVAGPWVPPVNLAGTPRPVDGDGDGVAMPDMGAFEFHQADADGDGYPMVDDCDDTNPAIHPGATELPGNTTDEDCDGKLDCDPTTTSRNHGRFVRCVAQTCNQLIRAGLADRQQCSDLSGRAARSAVASRQRGGSLGPPEEP